MRLSVTSKSRAEASLTPVSGIATLLLLVSREMRLMSALLEKSRKASGTMQVFMSLMSSRPMGQAQRGPCGRYRHRWLQPPLSSAQGFVPEWGERQPLQTDCKWKVKLVLTCISHTVESSKQTCSFSPCILWSNYFSLISCNPLDRPYSPGLESQCLISLCQETNSALWRGIWVSTATDDPNSQHRHWMHGKYMFCCLLQYTGLTTYPLAVLQVKNLQSYFHIHSMVSSLQDASEAALCNTHFMYLPMLEIELRGAWH